MIGLISVENERLMGNYDASMVATVRETATRLDSTIVKLKTTIDELKRLQGDWQKYTSELDDFRRWILRRVRFRQTDHRGYRNSLEVRIDAFHWEMSM